MSKGSTGTRSVEASEAVGGAWSIVVENVTVVGEMASIWLGFYYEEGHHTPDEVVWGRGRGGQRIKRYRTNVGCIGEGGGGGGVEHSTG